jgi:hypothetical protein
MLVPITFPPDQVFPAKAFATLYIPMAIDHLNLILQLSVNHNRKWWRLYSTVIVVRFQAGYVEHIVDLQAGRQF